MSPLSPVTHEEVRRSSSRSCASLLGVYVKPPIPGCSVVSVPRSVLSCSPPVPRGETQIMSIWTVLTSRRRFVLLSRLTGAEVQDFQGAQAWTA